MPLRNRRPLTIRPVGVSDAIDGTNAFPGAMAALTNLIPSSNNASIFVPRPAAITATNFSSFVSPKQTECLLVLGQYIFGLIASSHFAGKSEPFCYDLKTSAFITITGADSANTPTTQAATGDWQPPHMEVVGHYIVITDVGYDGVTYFYGLIDISNFSSLAYTAGNTATNALPSVPVWVSQFNGRAYFAVGDSEWFTDSLDPTTITNASQVLTFGDNTAVTCSIGLPLQNMIIGGIVQSLIVVKGAEIMYQVTGDPATTNLTVNALNVSIGTLAPNSMCPTPLGIAFIAPDGLRIIDFNARISDPVGANGEGVNVPFINALFPSRICAAFNQNTLRMTVQNGIAGGTPFQEYWFNFKLKHWTGPHSFPMAIIQPCFYNNLGFVSSAVGINAALWTSQAIPTATSSYVENGAALACTYQTVLLPDNDQMAMNSIVQSAIALQLPANSQVTVQALNEVGLALDPVYILAPPGSTMTWGSSTWGSPTTWGTSLGYFQQYAIPWNNPLVFKQMSITITGAAAEGFAIGNLYLKYQILGYMLDVQTMLVTPIQAPMNITTEGGVVITTEDGVPIQTEGIPG